MNPAISYIGHGVVGHGAEVGHNRTISLFGLLPFNGLLHFKSCRITNSSFSANPAVGRMR